jgi:hypothetical protein
VAAAGVASGAGAASGEAEAAAEAAAAAETATEGGSVGAELLADGSGSPIEESLGDV